MRHRSVSARTDHALPRPLAASDLPKVQGGLPPEGGTALLTHEVVHVVQPH